MKPMRHNGQPYNGINVLMLWGAAMEGGFRSPYWMTFRQAKELGGFVRKGERGITRHFNVKKIWSRWCEDVRFAPMPSGHFIPEEAPGEALEALMDFLCNRKEPA